MREIDKIFNDLALGYKHCSKCNRNIGRRTDGPDSIRPFETIVDHVDLKNSGTVQSMKATITGQTAGESGFCRPSIVPNNDISSDHQESSRPAAPAHSSKATEQSVYTRLRAAWGAKNGDDRYDASVDFDGNGSTNILDWQAFLKGLQSDFESMKETWGQRSSDENYNNNYDYNNDGRINILDWQKFVNKWVA